MISETDYSDSLYGFDPKPLSGNSEDYSINGSKMKWFDMPKEIVNEGMAIFESEYRNPDRFYNW